MGGSNPIPTTPNYQGGSVNFGGGASATAGEGTTSYNNPAANQQMTYDQSAINSILPQLNVLSPQVQTNLQNQAQATMNNGMQQLQNNYNTQQQGDINNIAQRFGGLNTSALSDQTYQLNQANALGMSNLQNQYTGNLQNMENNALNQQTNYYNTLMGNYGTNFNQAGQAMGMANQNSQLANAFNQQGFNNQFQTYNAQNAQNQQMMNTIGQVAQVAAAVV